ncbi:hypothetical protein C1H46_005476 [Malus baccata]|uniref:Uncharacterized protein n=1 Tax=Malus baccata TaxID=106549 RepID=A0A540NCV1_MALBA|nr:hypothetical protein C1H46_005476 [Malus baccata]
MASEVLEEKKPEDDAPVAEKPEAEAEKDLKEEAKEEEQEKEEEKEKEKVSEASEKVTEKEEEKVVEEGQEEKEKESEETPKKTTRGRKASLKKVENDQTKSKKRGRDSAAKKSKEAKAEKKEKEAVTPVSERPTRERKLVERYSAPESGRSSGTKSFSIEKGHGTELKNIPNVAFKMSKRKADDNLQLLHTILFGKKAKPHSLKKNISQFSGYVWVENEQEKHRARVKEKIDKCVKEKLMDFCDLLNIPVKGTTKKEDLSVKLLEFLESPHATTDVLLAEKEQKGQKRRRKATPSKAAGSGEASPETSAKKQKETPNSDKKQESSKADEEENDDKVETSDVKDDSGEDDDHNMVNEESEPEEKSDEEQKEPKDQCLPRSQDGKPHVNISIISWHFKLGCKCFDPISELVNIFAVLEIFDKIFLEFSIFPLYGNSDPSSPEKKVCNCFKIRLHTTSCTHSRSTCKDEQRKESLASIMIQ